MSTTDPTSRESSEDAVRKIIRAHYDRGDPTGWFEALYAGAGNDASKIPWADRRPNPSLVSWLSREKPVGRGKRCIVVGCGLGDDAELLARHGYRVTAFDLSESAIAWCRRRYPSTSVTYLPADLLKPPAEWAGGFDFVFEACTIQALPHSLRAKAIDAIAALVGPGGELLVIARGRDESDDPGELPWPLTHAETARFDAAGLKRLGFEDFMDGEEPPVRRFRVHFARPPAAS